MHYLSPNQIKPNYVSDRDLNPLFESLDDANIHAYCKKYNYKIVKIFLFFFLALLPNPHFFRE